MTAQREMYFLLDILIYSYLYLYKIWKNSTQDNNLFISAVTKSKVCIVLRMILAEMVLLCLKIDIIMQNYR